MRVSILAAGSVCVAACGAIIGEQAVFGAAPPAPPGGDDASVEAGVEGGAPDADASATDAPVDAPLVRCTVGDPFGAPTEVTALAGATSARRGSSSIFASASGA